MGGRPLEHFDPLVSLFFLFAVGVLQQECVGPLLNLPVHITSSLSLVAFLSLSSSLSSACNSLSSASPSFLPRHITRPLLPQQGDSLS